ncbi:MAG: efflux RND transporter periplasmic adaptor subunit [Ferruginibacter sp.]
MKVYFKNFLFVSILFSICVAFESCGSKEKKITASTKAKGPMPMPRVDGYVVKTVPVTENLELPGSLIANESTEIHPEISGRMTYLNAAEGKSIGRGGLIAKIYDGDLVAQLNKLRVQLQVAEQTANRYNELLKINGVSQQEYDLQALQITNIWADMSIVRSNITRTEVRAPFTGVLGLKNVSPGAYITPQTVITTIRQNSQLKLDFTLPEKYSGKITNGQLLNFSVEGNAKTYAAKVVATEAAVTEESRSLHVRAMVTNNDGKLLPGTFVKVQTKFDPDPNAIMIPSQAIVPQARGKQVVVYRGGTVSFDNVITGIRDSAMVQITSGLKVGDTIIITGLMSLKPGGKVELNKQKGVGSKQDSTGRKVSKN